MHLPYRMQHHTERQSAFHTVGIESKYIKGATKSCVSDAEAPVWCVHGLFVCMCVGAQLHHLTQVGLSSRMNGYPAGIRAAPGHNGGIGWNHYHDDSFSRTEPEKDAVSESQIVFLSFKSWPLSTPTLSFCPWIFLFAISLYIPLNIFPPLPLSPSAVPSFLPSVPGLSWLLALLYLPDTQKCYQGALGTPCPPWNPWGGLSVSSTALGYISSYPLLCLLDQGHQGGAVASLPETDSCAKLPQLKPHPPVCSSNQSCHWPRLPASPNLTILPMEVPEGVQQRDSPAKLKWRGG